MWKTSWTSVTPSATRPGEHQPGTGADVRGPHRRARQLRHPPDHRMVAVGPGVGAEADHLLDEPEPGLENVLGDHRRAVGDAARPIAIGCRSVGKPGKGSVEKFTALGRSYWTTRKPSSVCVDLGARRRAVCPAPAAGASGRPRSPRCRRASSPRRSPTWRRRCDRRSHDARSDTAAPRPVIVSVECRRPDTLAPIWFSIVHRSTISGSRAALSIVVTPSASTAAIRMFSVAPTDGKSSWISAPRS